MKTPILASLLCFTLAGTTLVPLRWVIAAPAEETSPRTIRLEVDASALEDKGVGIDGIVRDQLRPKLSEAGYEVIEGSAATHLRVRVVPLRVDRFDYGLHFEFIEGTQATAAIEWVACMTCVDAKLLPTVDQATPALLEALSEHVAKLEAESESETEGASETTRAEDTTDGTSDTGDHDEVPSPIGPMGIAGAVGIAAGVALSIGGGVELGRGEVEDLDPSEQLGTRTDHGPVGRALLGAGIGVAVVGVALLATDLALRAKQRKRAASKSVFIIPALSPGFAGLGIHGRF